MMEFVWVDLQHQPQGADVWVSFEGSGMLQCYLIPSPQFNAFVKGDAVDCFQFDVAPPEHVVQIPREGLWHVVMRGGVGEAEVRVSPPARLDANVRAILQPEKYQDPTPDPGTPHLTEAPLAGPTDWLAGLQHATDQAVMDQMAKIQEIQRQLDDTVAAAYTGGPGGAGFDATNARVNQLRGELITALDALGLIPDYSAIDPKSVRVDPDGPFSFKRTEDGITVMVYGEFKNGTGKFFDQANLTYYTFTSGKLANTTTLDPGRVTPDDALLFNTITALVGAPALAALVKAGGVGAFRGLQALLTREGADRVTGITGKNVIAEALAAAERRAPNASVAASSAASNGSLKIIGERFTESELAVANLLKDRGHTVVLRQADPKAPRTSDLLVDGFTWDVYTPVTKSVDALPRAIGKKAGQAKVVVVDLRDTSITIEEAIAANIPARVRGQTSQVDDVIFVNTVK